MNATQVTLAGKPVLETERLILRAPVAEDWPVWGGFMRSDRACHVGGPMVQPGQSWRNFGYFIGHWILRSFGMFVMVEKGSERLLGAVRPWFPEGWAEREIGWTIWRPETEGRGFAHEAARAARAHAFTRLGWTTAVSYIAPQNTASIALAERLGAQTDLDAALPAPPRDMGRIVVYRHSKEDA